MSSSPDDRAPVLRGQVAADATAATFGVDLRRAVPTDSAPVERAKEAARNAGYAEGWAQGQRAAAVAAEAARQRAVAAEQAHDTRRAAALAQAVNALGRAVTGLESQLLPTLAELNELVLGHAVELAEAIVGREISEADGRGPDALRRAMTMVPAQGAVTVRLHPDDYRNLVGSTPEADFNYHGHPVHLRPDPSLRPGDAVAETGSTTVDASIAAAMQRAREVLDL